MFRQSTFDRLTSSLRAAANGVGELAFAAAFHARFFKIVLPQIATPLPHILPDWNAVTATLCLQRPQSATQRNRLVHNDLDSHP
jgi:hypothetical protein